MKKRIVALLLSVVMILPLAACNRGVDLPAESQIPLSELGSDVDSAIVGGGGDTQLASDEYDAEDAKAAAMNFAVKLFQESLKYEKESREDSNLHVEPSEGPENLLISPLSVYLALGMTENGAKGKTLAQMENVLGLSAGQMNSYTKEYMENLSDEIKIANSIWVTEDKRFTFEDHFGKINKEYYGADVYKAPFDESTVKAINDWVEEKTDGTIKDILDHIPMEAVMYLINALAFEAEWENTYDESQVREGIFTAEGTVEQKVDMMYSDEQYYMEDENATGFLKYYDGKDYAFAALLPNEGVDVYNYVSSLSGEHLQKLLENPIEVHVNAAIPQFEAEYQIEMKDVLMEMGIVDAFDADKADLSGLGTSEAGNIFVDRVIHKTFIEVSPMGTKAGAATVIEISDECAVIYEETKDVILDRPFIYMIIDCETNQPIFMGVVNYIDGYRE